MARKFIINGLEVEPTGRDSTSRITELGGEGEDKQAWSIWAVRRIGESLGAAGMKRFVVNGKGCEKVICDLFVDGEGRPIDTSNL